MKTTKSLEKGIIKTIIKWIVILSIMVIVGIFNRDFLGDALQEIKEIPISIVVLCVVLGMLYYVAEGIIISYMTIRDEKRINFIKGFQCSLYCGFYKFVSLGSGGGIAQVYYYSCEGIKASKGTGMMIVQYTILKITVGILGILSFLGLILMKDTSYMKYSKYMILGTVVIILIIAFLIILAVSKRTTKFVFDLLFKLIKEESILYPKLVYAMEYTNNLQEQGRELWANKFQFINVILLNIFRLASWYVIPAFIFGNWGYDVNIISCIALMSVVNMISGVMIAPAGIGTLEFVFVLFFGNIFTDVYAASALIVYRFFTWIFPFFIEAIVVGMYKRSNKIVVNKKS